MQMPEAEYKAISKEEYVESGSLVPPVVVQYPSEEEYLENQNQGQGQGAPGHQRSNPEKQVQKLSQYEMQHLSIHRQGMEQAKKYNNQFEQKYHQNQLIMGTKELKSQFIAGEEKYESVFKKFGGKDHTCEIMNKNLHFRQEIVGQSMGGLNIYQLTITKRREQSMKHKRKACIYLQARQHAAETHGSFVMQSILHEIVQNYSKYDKILHNYVIKMLPMLNPDGVVIGNSRSSLAGLDLNRRWSDPNPIMHPEVYFVKQSMKQTEKQCRGISVFADLHGHNK